MTQEKLPHRKELCLQSEQPDAITGLFPILTYKIDLLYAVLTSSWYFCHFFL